VLAADVVDVELDGCTPVRLDVTDETAWAAAMPARLDVLVNNAGIIHRTPIDGGDVATFEAVTRVNLLGVYLGMRAAAPVMPAGGSIVNVSSIDGMVGMPLLSGYVASKWAVRGMTKTAAAELGPRGIRCNSVHPGYIETAMLTAGGRMSAETMASLADQVPLGTLGTTGDIAAACAYLASDASRYVNGTELVVDGGLIAALKPAA
jgi:3alpha(or 20beta)-hydroxysteroid dehydrogenase